MIADQAQYAEPDEDPFVNDLASAFLGANLIEPNEMLFPDESEKTLSIWDDVDWWTGERKDAKFFTSPPKAIYESETFAEEAQTLRENPELLKTPRYKEQTVTQRRWFQQDNGRIPLDRLVRVGGNNFLRPDAAQAFRAMKRAAKKDGINITFSGEQSGYRDYDTQVRLFNEKGDSDTGGLAADPGTSNHGWGMAIDIGPEARAWVAQHGKRFGFHGIPSESWHFDFKPTAEMEYKVPVKRRPRTKAERPGRELGGSDLTDELPIAPKEGGFLEAVMSLVDEEVPVDTVKGKRHVNLSGVEKPKNRDDIVAYARQVAKRYGWTGKQWLALYELGQRESGWDPKAVNESSGATGIPQLLPSAHKVPRNWNDPRVQVRWFVRYVSERYGNPTAAIKHHDRENWY